MHAIGPEAAALTEPLLKALEIEDWDLQWAAADALGSIASRDPEVTSALIVTLGHKSGIVCGAAAHALAAIGDSAIPPLVKAIQEGDDNRREWAADVLGHLGPNAKVAVKPLKKLLRDKNPNLRAWSAIALGKIAGLKEVIPILVGILDRPNLPGIRCQAIEALGSIGVAARRAVPALKKILGDENEDIRAAVIAAITDIEG